MFGSSQIKKVFTLYLSYLLVSCASTDVVKLREAPPGAGQGEVELFTSEAQLQRPYEELALLEVNDGGWGMSGNDLTEKLKEEAEALNADAVILQNVERHSTGGTYIANSSTYGNLYGGLYSGSSVGSGTYVEGEEKILRGLAVAYKGKNPKKP